VTEKDRNQAPQENDQLSKEMEIIPEEILEGLPEEKRKEITIFAAEHFSGPLPHPKIMADYKKVLPDAPERIFNMAEKQQNHRIKLEESLIKGDIKRADLGLIFGFILFLLLFMFGFYLIATGNDLPGYILTATGIILSTVSAFLRVGVERDTKKDKKES
jgi:uncharacterized membrane protein